MVGCLVVLVLSLWIMSAGTQPVDIAVAVPPLVLSLAAAVASFWRAGRVPRGQSLPWHIIGTTALAITLVNQLRFAANFDTFAEEAMSLIRVGDVATRLGILLAVFVVLRLRAWGSHIEFLVDGLIISIIPLVLAWEILLAPALQAGVPWPVLLTAAADFYVCCVWAGIMLGLVRRGQTSLSLALILVGSLGYLAHSFLLLLATVTVEPAVVSDALTNGIVVTGVLAGATAAASTLPPSARTLTAVGHPTLPALGSTRLGMLGLSMAALPLGIVLGPLTTGDDLVYGGLALLVLVTFIPRVNVVLRQRDAAIGQQQATQRDLRRRVSFDQQTGLPNRQMIERYLTDSLRRDANAVAVLFMDLDDFKLINDNFGHASGDGILATVAERLLMAQHSSELVARFGGDEFIVVLSEVLDVDEAVEAAQRYVAAARGVEQVGGYELSVGSSCGVAMGDRHSTPESLIRDADLAMYAAKRGPTSVVAFNDVLRTASLEQLRTEQGLLHAIRNGELRLQYQPLVDLATDDVVGVEALVRWTDKHGVVHSPQHFIDVAERSGLIHEVGRAVLEMICEQILSWRAEDLVVSVSMNVSANELGRDGYVRDLLARLERSGIPPDQLAIELTERAIVGDSARLIGALGELRDAGITIAVDDFGTGYFSFSQLRSIPIDLLKIDRSFVRDMLDDEAAASIVRACLELASGVDVPCIAEGVEDEAIASVLRRLGCLQAQGYHLGRPMSATDIAAILSSQRPGDASLLLGGPNGLDGKPGQQG